MLNFWPVSVTTSPGCIPLRHGPMFLPSIVVVDSFSKDRTVEITSSIDVTDAIWELFEAHSRSPG